MPVWLPLAGVLFTYGWVVRAVTWRMATAAARSEVDSDRARWAAMATVFAGTVAILGWCVLFAGLRLTG